MRRPASFASTTTRFSGAAGRTGSLSCRRLGLVGGALALVVVAGCGGSRPGPYQAYDDGRPRDIQAGAEHYRQARPYRNDDPQRAEALLREALTYDLYNGPAHNDLGVLLLAQGKLYEAANEFEWARKLMPGHPDPRVNLAVVLERGGKADDSIRAAQAALEVQPGYLPALQTLAYVQMRYGLWDTETADHLDTIIERSDDPQWLDWARRQRFKVEAR